MLVIDLTGTQQAPHDYLYRGPTNASTSVVVQVSLQLKEKTNIFLAQNSPYSSARRVLRNVSLSRKKRMEVDDRVEYFRRLNFPVQVF